MAENVLDEGEIAFQAEGRLLQELGLRLVASPEVALVELIKNAYDADSPTCKVSLEDEGKCLVVADEGQGMTLEDFTHKWMRIATATKLRSDVSSKYHRPLTGAKGIGRFAVRYLGDHLTLQSVAKDSKRKCVTRLTATFDWLKLDKIADLTSVKVDYLLEKVADDEQLGTTLRVKKLREGTDFVSSKELRNDVLRMVSPLSGLDSGDFASGIHQSEEDPGFKVSLPGGEVDGSDIDLAKLILDNYWARLTIKLKKDSLTFTVKLSSNPNKKKELQLKVDTVISKGFFADIRFFPRRAGIFSGKGFNGKNAWSWVRENCGVAIIDHGFRIKPYGFPNDDWLKLDTDTARNIRDWRTPIAKEHFAVPELIKNNPAANPVLNLPYNLQLVGAVFVETSRRSSHTADLIPAMDREGLLANAGAAQLEMFVRAGIELLAHQDKAELLRLEQIEADEAARRAREDIKKAIRHIEKSPTLTVADKVRIKKQYVRFAERLDEQEEYSAKARQSLSTMSLLGVVAGFMTHESKAAVHDLEQAVTVVRRIATKNPELRELTDDLEKRLENFRNYLDYSQMFIRKVREQKIQPLSAAGQVRHIMNTFKDFAQRRGIEVVQDIEGDVTTPPLPVTVYSGLLLNLYTNALKAVIAAKSSVKTPRILFRAWNDPKHHFVEVADNGIGIPPEVRSRIWDPLYTTTSDEGNPLGSGMGLGLTLVDQVVKEFKGTVTLLDKAPPEFVTCFRLTFPLR